MSKYSKTTTNNKQVCGCGKHYGIGEWTPEQVAQSYNWHRQTGINYTADKQRYLRTWEEWHGKLAKDDFVFNRP